MTQNDDLFVPGGDRNDLKRKVRNHMLKGFFIGGVAATAVGLFVFGLYLLGELLPPESKEAGDPSYGSVIEEIAPADVTKLT